MMVNPRRLAVTGADKFDSSGFNSLKNKKAGKNHEKCLLHLMKSSWLHQSVVFGAVAPMLGDFPDTGKRPFAETQIKKSHEDASFDIERLHGFYLFSAICCSIFYSAGFCRRFEVVVNTDF